ncbi:LytTR family DNA-binding domain-containing protein [Clostridium sp. AM58-1XD]|uniref:LytR/AlgR family response regulator transcription factor n=1 Tax=Clostridium sp. AM58-1XD TaxID=2292307 RepID=UPI000E50D94B|nr:LytTR family DNA-binding domain-containing protein [Clostridium sp. AM58-1XD]RGY97621.1 DNA-binding response regulator [Clostridium sp. AM58-1XD]
MKIAIIDDERPARRELRHQIELVMPDAEISEANSGASALELFGKQVFDLIFVDIDLRDMKGTVLAAAVLKMLPEAQIVFATAYSEYALEAFEMGAANYIIKPFDPERVKKIVQKCSERLHESPSPKKLSGRLVINSSRKTIVLDVPSIIYIETGEHGCILHTKEGDYTENAAIGDYEKRLQPYYFYRIHKSYLVNLRYISEIFLWYNNSFAIKLKQKADLILPVGREKIKGLRQILNEC